MVIDSSAIVSVILNEPDAGRFVEAMKGDLARSISAASVLECSIVLEGRLGEEGGALLDLLLDGAAIRIVPVEIEHLATARLAYRQFGRGRHKAALNFGDCFSYALAKLSGEPLLCKGNDFVLTDLAVVSYPRQD